MRTLMKKKTSSQLLTSFYRIWTHHPQHGKMMGKCRDLGEVEDLGFRHYAAEDPPWKILKEPDLRSFLKARERWGGNYQGPLGRETTDRI
jgi:hypothetical protein